ncbi:response regulator transcription factor [Thiomicrorhabdus sp. ZW0627]|uniref:response regulator transcription factor n=1 Tax=Thiomicrorhabdus sp. ZW0627 TaxID=3039774 RepID=UPI0024369356|nr:response regulator transcription factor [Thiomicrorhabdus sp. ZW0627]MDG6774472.1 response regulator transcription factor [Thiomicrorhabdus sp. ZW0627]
MKPILIYVQNPNALNTWLSACEREPQILYNLDDLESPSIEINNSLLLLHKTEDAAESRIADLSKRGLDILLFSNKPSVEESMRFFKLGIKGYLNTFANKNRIQQAIETVQVGNIWLGQNIMQAMIESVTHAPKSDDGWKDLLTDREIEVTSWVLQSKTNKEIAQSLDITERTVKAHLQNIFQKLTVKDRLSLVLKVQNWSTPGM